MKKSIFSIILILSMVFSLSVPCFAADNTLTITSTSTSIEEKYSDAGELMKSLGIMVGYTDGKLHLENNITRAEFVTMIVRTLGYDYLLGSAQNKFVDVPDNYWAKDYIAVANALGLVEGVGNKKFNPNANVTIVEAEAILLRVLGYGDLAAKIGWPNGYSIYASQIGLTEDINIWNNTPATRGHLAQLISNSLDIPFYNYFNQNKGNILTNYLGYKTVDGVITDTALTDSNLELNEVKIDDKYYTFDSNIVPAYIGEKVSGYMDNKGNILYLKADNEDIVMGFIDSVTSKKVKVNGTYYEFAKEYDVYVNNKDASSLDVESFAKLVFDKDNKVSAVYSYKFTKNSLMVTEVNDKYIKLFDYSTGNNTQYSIKDKQVIVYDDDKFTGIDTLKKDFIVSLINTSNSLFFYTSDNGVITGKLSSISSSKGANINDKTYEFDTNVTYSLNNNSTVKKATTINDLSALIGLRVTAVLNHNGKITHIYAKQAAENLSVGIVVAKSTSLNKYIEIFDIETGKYETYYYTTKTNKYNDNNPISFEDIKVFNKDDTFTFVEITYNDDEIVTISKFNMSEESTIQKMYNSSIKTETGTYYVSRNTVVIKADDNADEISLVDWDSIKNSSVNNNVKIIVITEKDSVEAKYIIITDGYEFIGKDIEYGVVNCIGRSIYGDFYELYTLDGESSITLKGEAAKDIKIGDIISFRLNIDELAVDVQKVEKTYDEISFIIDNEYLELKNLNNYYEIHNDVMVFDVREEALLEDQISDIRDLRVGDAIEYVVNNENKIIYIQIVNKIAEPETPNE